MRDRAEMPQLAFLLRVRSYTKQNPIILSTKFIYNFSDKTSMHHLFTNPGFKFLVLYKFQQGIHTQHGPLIFFKTKEFLA